MTTETIDLQERQDDANRAKAQAERKASEEVAAQTNAGLNAKYQVRPLRGDDLFKLLSIIGKLDVKDEFVEMFMKNAEERYTMQRLALVESLTDKKPKKGSKSEQDKVVARINAQEEVEKRGIEIMGILLNKILMNMPKVRYELNEFLGELINSNADEVGKMPIAEYIFVLSSLVKSEDFKTFFTSTASLMG